MRIGTQVEYRDEYGDWVPALVEGFNAPKNQVAILYLGGNRVGVPRWDGRSVGTSPVWRPA